MSNPSERFTQRINAISSKVQAIVMYNEYVEGLKADAKHAGRSILRSAILYEVRKGRVSIEQADKVIEWMGLDK